VTLAIFLMASGWLIHWLATVIKAREMCKATHTPPPSLWEYWTADPYTLAMSVLALAVSYFVIPYAAHTWPTLAEMIGQHDGQPMNPMTALLGGYVSPSLADLMGKRLAAMVA